MGDQGRYVGAELELFSRAHNWKRYFGSFLRRHLVGRVLEVGAGLGSTAQILCDGSQEEWLCLEPDPQLAAEIQRKIAASEISSCCAALAGTIEALPPTARYNAIIYIDVIEHLEDEAAELERAAARLEPGGKLVVLAPAHHWLYSPFDEAIGHLRRYDRKRLAGAIPSTLERRRLIYLDSVGLAASAVNRLILREPMPTARQIAFWDRAMVPLSRVVDPLLFYGFGKSVLGIWERP